jgi:hypothetical protein
MVPPIDTNSGEDSSGKPGLGLDLEQITPVIIGWGVGAFYLSLTSMSGAGIGTADFVVAGGFAFGPFMWVVTMIRGRPPHYQRDAILSLFGFGKWHQTPAQGRPDARLLPLLQRDKHYNGREEA